MDAAIAEMSHIFRLVDYTIAPPTDLAWLGDADDRPIVQTALAARAAILVTANARDFPIGEARNGVQIVNQEQFIATLYDQFPTAEVNIQRYLH